MKDLYPLVNKFIAHRGIHNEYIKENTSLAIEKAIIKKVPIEMDVTLTKDNVVVLCHDGYIKYKKKRIYIKEMAFKKIKNYDKSIITLAEVLKLVDGKVPLLVELKPYNKGRKLEKECVKLLDNYNGYFAIQSFDPLCVYWFKRNRKNYIRGQLLTNKYNYNFITNIIYKHMIFNIFTKPDFISYNIKGLPNPKIAKVRDKLVVLGWTVRKKEELIKYQDYCDNFIAENIF